MDGSKKERWVLLIVLVLVVCALCAIYVSSMKASSAPPPMPASSTQYIQAIFSCDAGKTIDATFMNASTSSIAGNQVQLVLSDGRTLALPQAISADGARYANADESLVFWNKGNGAFITENGTTTYANCVAQNQ